MTLNVTHHECAHKHEWASGNIYIRRTAATAGDVILGHTHNFDHTTIFFTGSFRVRVMNGDEEQEQTFVAPAHALIAKEWNHEITCLEDGEFWCVYAHRDPQSGDVVQEYNGWHHAYEAARAT